MKRILLSVVVLVLLCSIGPLRAEEPLSSPALPDPAVVAVPSQVAAPSQAAKVSPLDEIDLAAILGLPTATPASIECCTEARHACFDLCYPCSNNFRCNITTCRSTCECGAACA
jgi:hypothetical protein